MEHAGRTVEWLHIHIVAACVFRYLHQVVVEARRNKAEHIVHFLCGNEVVPEDGLRLRDHVKSRDRAGAGIVGQAELGLPYDLNKS